MKTKALIPEPPLMILPSLAKKIGLNEAVILQQMHYWLANSQHLHENKKWIYNSYPEWQKQFPFWSISTIKRTILNLEKKNLILTDNFNKLKMDRTKWYTILYENLPTMDHDNLDIGSICADQDTRLTRPLPENTTESTTENVSKETVKVFSKPSSNLIDFWSSLGNTQKHNSSKTKTYQKAITYIKHIKNGTLYKIVNLDMDYLKKNNISIEDLKQKLTDNQIKRIMKNLNLLFAKDYVPEDKKVLPKSLPDLIFNPRSGISWFYAYSKNPPKKLYQKIEPKFPDIYKMYRGLFDDLTDKEEYNIINAVNRITKFHTEQCKILDPLMAHCSFSSWFGAEGHPENFCEQHVNWLSKLRDIKINSITQTNPENGLFKSFLKWMEETHQYNIYPNKRELDHLKGVWKESSSYADCPIEVEEDDFAYFKEVCY